MVVLFRIIALISICSLLLKASGQETLSSRPAVSDFLQLQDFVSPSMSPSGRYVAGVKRLGTRDTLLVMDLDAADFDLSSIGVGEFNINWVEWVSDERLVVGVTGYRGSNDADLMSREAMNAADPDADIFYFQRILAVDRDGSNKAAMFPDGGFKKDSRLGNFVDPLTNDEDHILMSAWARSDHNLYRVNVYTGEAKKVANGNYRTSTWYVDASGRPAFRREWSGRSEVTFYSNVKSDSGRSKWEKLKTIRFNAQDNINRTVTFLPFFAGQADNTFYIAESRDGEDKVEIYLYDYQAKEYIETVGTHSEFDIRGVLYDRTDTPYVGAYYYDDVVEIDFVDEDLQSHYHALRDYFGANLNVFPQDIRMDGQRWLLSVSGPHDSGGYYIYDRELGSVDMIASRHVSLSDKALAPAQVIEYQARDGLALKGYLTQPIQHADVGPAPLIVMPHGGPASRDIISYQPTVQILASKGYQVFQPTFRGSSGFGRAFEDLGRGQWGRAMQTDIEDGFAALVARGLASADEACVYGGSYGGYAALVAATFTPDLYQCVIAVAAPSDLLKMLSWERAEGGSSSASYRYWVNHIGDPKANRAELEAVSPARHAAQITAPILLIHGERDRVVPIKQSELMEEALEEAGKTYAFYRMEKAGHSYRSWEERAEEYDRVLAFLSTYLPSATNGPS